MALCSSLVLGFIVSGLVPDKGQQLVTELGDLAILIPEALADGT